MRNSFQLTHMSRDDHAVPSGNRTPGSRFCSDLLDTSVCIYKLVLKARSAARIIVVANLRLVPIDAHVT